MRASRDDQRWPSAVLPLLLLLAVAYGITMLILDVHAIGGAWMAPREPRPQEHTYTHPTHEPREPTELESALSQGDWAHVRSLVEGGASTDVYISWRESTVLMEAARVGELDVLRWLIDRGADVNARTNIGTSALSEAVSSDQWEACFALIRAGADVTLADEHGYGHAVLGAARAGRADVIEEFARLGVDVTASSSRGFSPLAAAARAGHVSIVQLLLRAGSAPDGDPAGDSVTPALDAASHGHMDVVRELIEHGGTVRAHPSPAFAATEPGAQSKDPREGAPLLHAARDGKLEDVQLLVEKGSVDVNAVDWLSETALMEAARSGHIEMVEWLLAHGAAVDAANDRGETALHVAVGGARADVVERLISAGAPLEASNREAMSVAHYAALAGQTGLLEQFRARGIALDTPNARGDTPLLLAARRGHTGAVRALLAAGADAHKAGARGNGATIGAVRAESDESLRALLEAGAPADAANAKGETALHEAARLGHMQLARTLIDALGGAGDERLRAVLEGRTRFDDTPLLLAAMHGKEDIVRLLGSVGADVTVVNRAGTTVSELLERARATSAPSNEG